MAVAYPTAPKSLDDLLALEAIRQLKAAYCRFVDTKQWQRLEALFTADAWVAGFGAVPDGSGPSAFVAGVAERIGNSVSVHHVHAPEITLTGPDKAQGIWPMMDYVEFTGAAAGAGRGWIGWGFYEEQYARVGGEWRIGFMRLARQRMDDLALDHPALKPGRIPPAPGWL
jgi:hypothetical protein